MHSQSPFSQTTTPVRDPLATGLSACPESNSHALKKQLESPGVSPKTDRAINQPANQPTT